MRDAMPDESNITKPMSKKDRQTTTNDAGQGIAWDFCNYMRLPLSRTPTTRQDSALASTKDWHAPAWR
jgi:hypothetical protein